MTEPRPDPGKVLEALAEYLSFDDLRSKYPKISDKTLKSILKKAADMFPKAGTGIPRSDAQWVAYIDGASRGNPGPAGAGAFIESDGCIIELRKDIGTDTNNAAEYEALLLAMNAAAQKGVQTLEVRSDSELLVKQMKGIYRVKNQALSKRFIKAKNLEKKFKSFKIVHIRREKNKEADRLANEAIDGVEG